MIVIMKLNLMYYIILQSAKDYPKNDDDKPLGFSEEECKNILLTQAEYIKDSQELKFLDIFSKFDGQNDTKRKTIGIRRTKSTEIPIKRHIRPSSYTELPNKYCRTNNIPPPPIDSIVKNESKPQLKKSDVKSQSLTKHQSIKKQTKKKSIKKDNNLKEKNEKLESLLSFVGEDSDDFVSPSLDDNELFTQSKKKRDDNSKSDNNKPNNNNKSKINKPENNKSDSNNKSNTIKTPPQKINKIYEIKYKKKYSISNSIKGRCLTNEFNKEINIYRLHYIQKPPINLTLKSLEKYNLPLHINQKPFCSNPNDLPEKTKTFGKYELKLLGPYNDSRWLKEFDTKPSIKLLGCDKELFIKIEDNNNNIQSKKINLSKIGFSSQPFLCKNHNRICYSYKLISTIIPPSTQLINSFNEKTNDSQLISQSSKTSSQLILSDQNISILYNSQNKQSNWLIDNLSDQYMSMVTPPNNKKISYSNEEKIKSKVRNKSGTGLHDRPYFTLFSLEVLVKTHDNLSPDPLKDTTVGLFYYIRPGGLENQNDKSKNDIIGYIICNNDNNLDYDIKTVDDLYENMRKCKHYTNLSDNIKKIIESSRIFNKRYYYSNNYTYEYPNLTSNNKVYYDIVDNEYELFEKLIEIITIWDPDFLIGYETQASSWGYLLSRSTVINFPFLQLIGRTPYMSPDFRNYDQYDKKKGSGISFIGRIVLNLWRIFRREIMNLRSYSFDKLINTILHKNFPIYPHQQLTNWFIDPLYRANTINYYLNRVKLNVELLDSYDFINQTCEFVRLYGILFSQCLIRGSQYKIESCLFRLTKPLDYILLSPSKEQVAYEKPLECLPLVLEPVALFQHNPIVILDFQSLYPSIISAYNMCYSTCLGRISYALEPMIEPFLGTVNYACDKSILKKYKNDIFISPNGVIFLKSNIRRGIMPIMEDLILSVRILVKKTMKHLKKEKYIYNSLDHRQNALKMIANTSYGYIGASYSGRMPCSEIADAIVETAKETLLKAINTVEKEFGGKVLYGDTDSMFIELDGKNVQEAYDIAQKIVGI